MAADTQSSSPFSRLPRLGLNFGFKHSPSSPLRETYTSPLKEKAQEKDDDWYIPYNGPIEAPRPRADSNHDRESWGDMLNGWLTEDPNESPQNTRSGRARALSTVTHLTSSSGNVDPSRKSVRMSSKQRATVPSFINLDQAGGIGDVPMPAERSSKYESTIATSPQTAGTSGTNPNRSSLASIWSFGKKSLRHSVSLDQLSRSRSSASGTRERANTSANVVPAMPTTSTIPMSSQRGNEDTALSSRPAPIAEDSEYYYSSLLVHQSTPGHPPPRQEDLSTHPYAVAFPSTTQTRSAPPTSYKGKAKALNPGKLTITWLDPRQKSVPGYLKPSPRNSILKASLSTPNLRDLPKGKQRWLSAETWCDAIILPRPRFALRLAEGQPSGRIVSPPGSPVSSPETAQGQDSRNRFARDPSSAPLLKQSVSLSNLISPPAPAAPPSREPEKVTPASQVPAINEPAKTLKPHRPKSWALDDLALPSPVPSLAQVLAEGEQLDKEREIWRAKAIQSFQNKRTRTYSRARSKSIGASQARRIAKEAGETVSPLEYLAERTLLGTQTVPPTIHVHAPPVPKSPHTTSASRTAISSVFSNHSQNLSRATSRTKSHGHSNSLGGSVTKSQTEHSSSGHGHGHGHGHARSQSLGKSAFRMVKNTATNAAVLCGFNEKSPMLSPLDEKAFAMEDALRRNDTKIISLQDQARNEAFQERQDVVVLRPTLTVTRESPDRLNGVSPTPSGLSVSAEGVGIAISSPLPSEEHSHEPIHIPAHPYAQGTSSYSYRQPIQANALGAGSSTLSPTGTYAHRQPVLVHPYAQASHPYASPGTQYIDVPPQSLYAELTPGHVREFHPDSIRYSPYLNSSSGHGHGHGQDTEPNSPQDQVAATPKAAPHSVLHSDHPYVRNNASRHSELVFGDALVRTMRHSASIDSGFGPSEVDDHNQAADSKGDFSGDEDVDRLDTGEGPSYLSSGRPAFHREISGSSSNALTSSSENINPVVFKRPDLSGLGHSSGSSPGMISHDSSPPLSPRVINDSDDLERFRDLFYKPGSGKRNDGSVERSRRPSQGSRKTSGSITFEVGSHSSRSLSGLTNLARQLSEDLREEAARREHDDNSSGWGSRMGSIRETRADDVSDDPKSLLSQNTSSSDSPAGTNLPLRLPNDTPFTSPTAIYPEDIHPEEVESSRASSIFDGSALSHDNPHFRIGEVGAVATPPIESSTQRFSTRLSVVADDDNQRNSNVLSTRVVSSQSGLTPVTPDAARSSYMTSDTGSRMSGLSDFPAPPTLTAHMSIGPFIPRNEDNTLTPFDESQHTTTHPSIALSPPLLREPSHDTFGIRLQSRENVGEAL